MADPHRLSDALKVKVYQIPDLRSLFLFSVDYGNGLLFHLIASVLTALVRQLFPDWPLALAEHTATTQSAEHGSLPSS